MPVERVIPRFDLPRGRGKVYRVVVHWTAGAYKPSEYDRRHYHFLIDGHGRAVLGARRPGEYLPHTRMLNTGSVGLALCGMGGARERPFYAGAWPITHLQWERAAQAAAEIIAAYDLALTERTCLFHSEVWRVYRRPQIGKWDINALPFEPGLTPAEVHAQFRRKVRWFLDRMD